jgi:hypothetical protein
MEKSKKSHGAKSGKYSGISKLVLILYQNLSTKDDVWESAMSRCEIHLSSQCNSHTAIHFTQGPCAKFMDSPYYCELELCGGAVTVSFSKYLPWQAMHFLQCSTHFSKTCCRPLTTSKFLASDLAFHGLKSPEIEQGEIRTV